MIRNFQEFLNELEIWGADPRLALDESFMGDTVFYQECLKKFSTESFVQTLRDTLARRQKTEAIRAAHTMKGNADYLGLFPVMDAAMNVLADLRADRFEQAAADLPELASAFAEFTALLTAASQPSETPTL